MSYNKPVIIELHFTKNGEWTSEFRAHRSCVNHVNTFRIIVEKSAEWQMPSYLCFIDFNTKDDSDILKILECWVLRALHNDCVEQQLSDQNKGPEGVRQLCVMSPLLFNIVLDTVKIRVSQCNIAISWAWYSLLSRVYLRYMSFMPQIF